MTAALLGLGLLWLVDRPLLAGLLLGCPAYKPQFGLVVPVLLIAGRHGRALMTAVGASILLCALATGLWGIGIWSAFIDSLPLTRTIVLESMNTGAWKLVSAFAAVRLNGGGIATAYAVQSLVTAAVLGAILGLRQATPRIRYALTAAGALLATPYAFDYDMVVLGVAIAFLVVEARSTGWRDWERTGLAFAFVAPLFARQVTEFTGIPVGLIAIVTVAIFAARRGWQTDAAPIASSDHRHPAVNV